MQFLGSEQVEYICHKYVFNGATVKQWFQTTNQYQTISYHISIQISLRKEIYLIRNSWKTSDLVTNTNSS